MHTFQIASGTVPGHTHLSRGDLLIGKNNQDAHLVREVGDSIIAVVCDGCGSSKFSEVGSRLGVALTASAIERNLDTEAEPLLANTPFISTRLFWSYVERDLLQLMKEMAGRLAIGETTEVEVIADHFLFTVVAAVVTPRYTVVATIGDGYYAVNGKEVCLGPFEANMPPYPAYNLVKTKFSDTPEMLKFKVQYSGLTEFLQSLLIGSDGVADLADLEEAETPGSNQVVGPLSQFWEEDRYFKNPDAVRRKLALLNSARKRFDRETGELIHERALLPDDTTFVAIRRTPLEE